MIELIALGVAAAAVAAGHILSRRFVRERLRYVPVAQSRPAPWVAGIGVALLASPVVWLLPVVGTGTALALGLGVGAGVAAGARDLRRETRHLALLDH
jgi:hypothetical protein